jgi:hypothetical protein
VPVDPEEYCTVRALTLKQPWAALAAAGVKPVENRSWRPSASFDGPLLIHAGMAWDPVARTCPHAWNALEDYTGPMAHGAVVAWASWVDVHPADGCCAPWGGPGGFHWVLDRVVAVDPVPATGKLRLWVPSADTLETCRKNYRTALENR